MKLTFRGLSLVVCLATLATTAGAHHSYTMYDIVNPISIKGKVLSYRYGNPHPILVVEETIEDGSARTWTFEGISTMMWNKRNLPKQIVTVGENVTVTGWPSRDGKSQMLLSTIVRETGDKIVLLEKVMQREARETAGLKP